MQENNNNNKNPKLVVRSIEVNGNVDVEGCLVLFPKYMLTLVELGKEIIVTGDKIGDRKACKILISGALGLNSKEICDVLIYNIEEKAWIAVNVADNCIIRVRRKGYDYYDYYPELKSLNKSEMDYQIKLNALINYVRIYSSTSLSIR